MNQQNTGAPGKARQDGRSQAQTLGSMTQQQSQSQARGTSGTGPSGHEVPDAQAGYGGSRDEHGRSEDDQAAPDSTEAATGADQPRPDKITQAEAALGGKAVPGEISPRPDEQARADANPQLYDG